MSELTTITPADIQTAHGVLEQSQGWLRAYEAKKIALSNLAVSDKLPMELDQKMNEFQVSARTAIKKMEDNRKPFTEKAHAFIKLFTELENKVKSFDKEIQSLRDKSAAFIAKENAEKAAKERFELAKKQDRIDLIANAEQQVRDAYSQILNSDKEELLNAFEKITLEQLDEFEQLLIDINPVLKYERWENIRIKLLPTQYHSQGEIEGIIIQALTYGGKFDKCVEHYKTEIASYAKHLLALTPHRRKALESGQQESKEAEELRKKQLQLEEDQARAAAEAAAKAAEQAKAEALLNQQIAEANRTIEAPKAIESYSITVTNRLGWVEIFKFYLSHTDEVDGEDLGKVKLDSMRLLAERLAKSTGEKIDSPHVVYEPKYKVTVRARKAA